MLEIAGVEPLEERVYRLLVTARDADATSVADRLGLPRATAARVLESLHAKGFLTHVPGSAEEPRFAAVPPDVALGPRLRRGEEALEWARGALAQLTDEYLTGVRRRDAGQLVEVVSGVASIRQQLRSLAYNAREEIRWFCKTGHVAMPSSDNDEEFEMLARGVGYRVIYERALLEEPGMLDSVAAGIRHGEQARATDSLPVRLAIADRAIALCPLVPGGDDGVGEPTAALVRSSSLLDALSALFETYWQMASPLLPDSHAGPAADKAGLSGDERALLSLLVAGVSDKAIATQLRVSQRTVQRRLYDLMRRTGTDTRTQLVWQVAQRGWLQPRP